MEDFFVICPRDRRVAASHVCSSRSRAPGGPVSHPLTISDATVDETRRRVRRRHAGPSSHWTGKVGRQGCCCAPSYFPLRFSSVHTEFIPTALSSSLWRRRYGIRRYREYDSSQPPPLSTLAQSATRPRPRDIKFSFHLFFPRAPAFLGLSSRPWKIRGFYV